MYTLEFTSSNYVTDAKDAVYILKRFLIILRALSSQIISTCKASQYVIRWSPVQRCVNILK